MNLTEVRAKYPQYNDLSDTELATALHRKFYSDMPFTTFARRIGADQVAEQSLYTQTAQAQRNEPGTPNFDAAVGAALTGNYLAAKEVMAGTQPEPGRPNLGPIANFMQTPMREAPMPSEITQPYEEWKRATAGLWSTPGGKAGTVVGNMLPASLAMFLPGMATVFGSGLFGLGSGGLRPTGEVGLGPKRLTNAAVSGATSAGLQYGLNRLGQWWTDRAAQKATEAAQARTTYEAQNAVRNAATQEAQQAGYVFPPEQVNPQAPGTINRVVGGVTGKLKSQQLFSLKNQGTTLEIAKQELGIPAEQPLTLDTIEASKTAPLAPGRPSAAQAYDAVRASGKVPMGEKFQERLAPVFADYLDNKASFPQDVDPAMDKLLQKFVGFENADARSLLKQSSKLRAHGFKRITNIASTPEAVDLGMAEIKTSNVIEDAIAEHLRDSGKPQLFQDFIDARVRFGKAATISDAFDEATGALKARIIAKEPLEKLSGGTRAIALAYKNYPKAMQDATQFTEQAYSPFDWWAIGSMLFTGHPSGAATFAARPLLRQAYTSPAWQATFAQPGAAAPSGQPNALWRLGQSALTDERTQLLSKLAPTLLRTPQQ